MTGSDVAGTASPAVAAYPLGATRCADRRAQRLGLPVEGDDIAELARAGHLQVADHWTKRGDVGDPHLSQVAARATRTESAEQIEQGRTHDAKQQLSHYLSGGSVVVVTEANAPIIYLCQAVDGTLIYATINCGSCRLWRGDGTTMVEEIVVEAGRQRRGTTFIDTENGTFWAPGMTDPADETPCWVDIDAQPPIRDDQRLIELDPAQFDITESPRGLAITRRIGSTITDGIQPAMLPNRDGPAAPRGELHSASTSVPEYELGCAPDVGVGD
ncbi:hypothetical protein ACIGO9_29950 [Nocardia asteroides]|uniref:hypothetical protein n=1 Tax=Nocardia asteroides TaxID=1824 RepID=UPI0037C9EB96